MISLPARFDQLLRQNPTMHGFSISSIESLLPWFKDNKTIFFPEYTDHGETHLQEVMATADSIIADVSWELLTPEDVAAILTSVLLHDCAMHLSEDGFYTLIEGHFPLVESRYVSGETPWPVLWSDFLSEAKRFDEKKLKSLFGDTKPVRDIPQEKLDMTARDKLVIGEFLRRHHARLAHEIALVGIPTSATNPLKIAAVEPDYADIFGFIARSHNLSLRDAVDRLEKNKKRLHMNIHVPFIMGLLRISDYIQIHAPRAPKELLKVKTLSSPLSKGEWAKHHAIKEISQQHDDPEAIYIDAEPKEAATFVGLRKLFADIQKELDATWAILGEIYGLNPQLRNLGISVRRIRSSLDSVEEYKATKKPDYIPKLLKFKMSDARMMELLIAPLYGHRPEVGIRELMQNCIDACLELNDLGSKGLVSVSEPPKVTLTLEDYGDEGGVLIIEDFGIGMTIDTIENFFLNIGASFRKSDHWKKLHETDGRSDINRTGRFGIGVLAAFLLGDEIEVTTRHVNEKTERGVKFLCRNGDDEIALTHTPFHNGTKVSVKLTKHIKNKLIQFPGAWDWFALEYPEVKRSIVSEEKTSFLNQKSMVPSAGANLDETEWNRVRADGFEDVLWTYKMKGFDRYNTGLICNGIHVTSNMRLDELTISPNSPSLIISVPHIAVYDPDGKMPINLQRDGLTTKSLPFQRELCMAIAKDIVEQLLNLYKNYKLSYDADNLASLATGKVLGLSSYTWRLAESDETSKFILSSKGLLPLDAHLIAREKPSYIIMDATDYGRSKGAWSSKDLQKVSQHYLSFGRVTETKQSQIDWIRSLLERTPWQARWFSQLPPTGKSIFVRKQAILGLVHPNGTVPVTLWKQMRLEWENERWAYYSFGQVPKMHFDLENIANDLDTNNSFGFGVYHFDWDDKETAPSIESSPFAVAWIEKVGGGYLELNNQST